MLLSLSVRNFALVNELDISFEPGLTVITGESGAGKSILLQALSLVLGARARRELTRPGAQQSEVTADFDVQMCPPVQTFLEHNELLDVDDPHRCLVRRIARVDGRSRAWINGIPVTIEVLRRMCSQLVALHGQFEQMQLVDPSFQLDWFDDFGVDENLRNDVKNKHAAWRRAVVDLDQAKQQSGADLGHMDLLRFQVEELNDLELGEHEFEELDRRFKRASRSQDMLASVRESLEILDSTISADLARVARLVEQLDDQHSALNETTSLLETVRIQTDESANYMRQYAESLNIDEQEAAEIAQRLDSVHALARKHKVLPSQLFEHADHIRERLVSLQNSQSELVRLEESVRNNHKQFLESARKLSDERKCQSADFCNVVVEMLASTALPGAKFDTQFTAAESEKGLDRIEYLVSTNPKYPPMPMGRIASGGELSRIALAILVVVAERSKLPCLVLDEADFGIGGITADVVGRMLRTLSRNNQVVCVTHAPQVAALGNSHVRVFKTSEQDIEVTSLSDQDRVDEIARMVGSREVNEQSRQYARTLLDQAQS